MDETGDVVQREGISNQDPASGLCTATTQAGRRCGAPIMRDGGTLCFMHSPATAKARAAAAKLGGVSTSSRKKLLLGRLAFGTLAEVKEARQALAAAVIVGQVATQKASVVAQLLKDAETAFATVELERRLDEIDAQVAALVALRAKVEVD